jgi:hypothetical protein
MLNVILFVSPGVGKGTQSAKLIEKYKLTHFSSGIINILIFSGSTFVIYYLTAYKLKLSPELNEFVNKQLLRLRLKPFD